MTFRHQLPQMKRDLFLTDGGLETTLLFHEGFDLPDFAAFPLVATSDGRAALDRYVDAYLDIAVRDQVGIIVETPTWRASSHWGERLGWSPEALAAVNRDAVDLLIEGRRRAGPDAPPIVVSGVIGPRGDGYVPGAMMTPDEARAYHSVQIETFASTAADMVCVLTMNYSDEAIGVAVAAADHEIPVCVSFTVETDGQLPSGESLSEAIARTDARTDGYPAYYMINCAHPTHFATVLETGADWTTRIHGIRANASTKSHAELDDSTELDAGDPDALGHEMAELHRRHPHLNVLGGCCGTDHRHIEAISRHCRR